MGVAISIATFDDALAREIEPTVALAEAVHAVCRTTCFARHRSFSRDDSGAQLALL